MLKIEKFRKEIENNTNNLRCYLAQVTTKLGDREHCSREGTTCSECLKLSLMDLLEEYKEPVKLTRFEYEYLKVAKENEYNFIARDENGKLFLCETKPWKSEPAWRYTGNGVRVFKGLFNFVKWEDEEPWNIDEILANCEVMQDEKS